ncbi:MAG: VPLPA-CTERM-specific exosortase XrtD [Pseudomonadales bacterium]|nr:VPLPA-CTERM-specific exosortase XrtD [Pseudomonadales bacterium]
MSYAIENQPKIKVDMPVIIVLIASLLFLIWPFYDGVEFMVKRWIRKEEYSHGFFLPVIVMYLIWERRNILSVQEYTGSFWGVLLTFFGLVGCLIGELATIYEAIEYGFVLAIWGIIISVTGLRTFKYLFVPMLILFMMIPLPNFIYHNLSAQLQLVSSQIGVAIINVFQIPVYLEGNVIDLGQMKLQVVEACSGLRYLFPLMTLGFILGYMFSGPIFFRVLIFLSSIPITILMNSFRIGLIGVTVEYWGKNAAEGVLHDFEGWVVFMSSLVIVLLEIVIFARLLGDKRSIADLLSSTGGLTESEGANPRLLAGGNQNEKAITLKLPFYSSLAVVALMTFITLTVPHKDDVIPKRDAFSAFPLVLSDWQGDREFLQPSYLDSLKLTDYLLVNFVSSSNEKVNFYVSYYDTQKKGRSAHSPKSCIPGDGWEISEFSQRGVNVSETQTIPVNRTIISKGGNRSLVYYWFQQRGRFITNEYMVKLYLLSDALTMGRTDGAMIRLTTPISRFEDIESADERLERIMRDTHPHLVDYIPN